MLPTANPQYDRQPEHHSHWPANSQISILMLRQTMIVVSLMSTTLYDANPFVRLLFVAFLAASRLATSDFASRMSSPTVFGSSGICICRRAHQKSLRPNKRRALKLDDISESLRISPVLLFAKPKPSTYRIKRVKKFCGSGEDQVYAC